MEEFKRLSGGKERVSTEKFRKSLRHGLKQGSLEWSDSEKMDEVLEGKEEVGFSDFLRWKMALVSYVCLISPPNIDNSATCCRDLRGLSSRPC